mgnify:CR=1 FL=1|tara:strand:- start:78 stop:764 length:687 start_codon:yes stop_codon:yes gene_type:complete
MDLTQLTDEQVRSLANIGNFAAIAELNRRSAMPSAIERDILRDQQGNIRTFNIPQNNLANYSDSELMESDTTSNLGILDILKNYIQGGGMFGMATRGITSLGNMLGDAFKGSRFYNPMGETGQRIFAPGSRAGDQFGLGFRRDANRFGNMLNRLSQGKNISQTNLQNIMDRRGLTGIDVQGMADSIAESAQTGYGVGDVGNPQDQVDAGRDYSSSPGAMAGDMEYGEE